MNTLEQRRQIARSLPLSPQLLYLYVVRQLLSFVPYGELGIPSPSSLRMQPWQLIAMELRLMEPPPRFPPMAFVGCS